MALHVPEYIRSVTPYQPGKPIEETQREYQIEKVIKLASNENPLGPSPKAVSAMKNAISDLHRYPDGSGFHLKKALEKEYDISSDQIILGNGSNEVIDMLIRTYTVAGDQIVTHQAAFLAYGLSAQIHGVQTQKVPIDSHLNWRVEDLLFQVRASEKVKVVFLANPNNPTGKGFSKEKLRELISGLKKIRDGSVLLVLDYAYWEYVTDSSIAHPFECMKWYDNTIILKTFSKIHGIAGNRIGFGVGRSEVIKEIEKTRQPFNVNSLALVAAKAALTDKEHIDRARKLNSQEMKFWEKSLNTIGVPYWNSQGNFILANVEAGSGLSGPQVFQRCLEKGVIFRPVVNYGFSGALRISLGTSEENKVAFEVLKKALHRGDSSLSL